MLSYPLKCRENTESNDVEVSKTEDRNIIILLKSPVCNSKKSKFDKEQEASRLFSQLGIRTPLKKIQLLSGILF